MSLEATLAVLNTMQIARIIGEYAIGGAVAAFYYLEPGTTFDVDIFIAWEVEPSGLLNLNPIYAYLLGEGYIPRGETISIEGWAVQFLPPNSPLVGEAIKQAKAIKLDNVPTRVFTREHLMAICLDTGRPKDVARLIEFAQEGKVDQGAFAAILGRHGLQEKWTRFQARFLNPW